MKKLVFLTIISALFSIGITHGQTAEQKIAKTTKKAAKFTSKSIGKGYRVSKHFVYKGTIAAINGVKKVIK